MEYQHVPDSGWCWSSCDGYDNTKGVGKCRPRPPLWSDLHHRLWQQPDTKARRHEEALFYWKNFSYAWHRLVFFFCVFFFFYGLGFSLDWGFGFLGRISNATLNLVPKKSSSGYYDDHRQSWATGSGMVSFYTFEP